jgi:hypothetical protein
VDNAGNVLTYNGTSWSSADNIDGTTALTGVSCAITKFCVAVDSAGNAFTYDGTAWSSADDIDGTTALNSVSCPTTKFCVAVDSAGNAFTYDGTAWSSADDIDASNSLKDVSCPTATFCVAVDSAGNVLTYSGGTWSTPQVVNPLATLSHVSCASPNFCAIASPSGTDTSVYLLNGVHVTTQVTNLYSTALTTGTYCYSQLLCFASFNNDTISSWVDGTGWSTPVATSAPATKFGCLSANECFTVDNAGLVYEYNGTDWASTSTTLTDFQGPLTALDCFGDTNCVAIDSNGSEWTYSAGAWNDTAMAGPEDPTLGYGNSFVKCWASDYCVTTGAGTTYTGNSSNAQSLIGGRLSGVSCGAIGQCVEVTTTGKYEIANLAGSITSSGNIALTSLTDTSVSCASVDLCLATGLNAQMEPAVYLWDGSTWISESFVTSVLNQAAFRGVHDSVSCSTDDACMIVLDDMTGAPFADISSAGMSRIEWVKVVLYSPVSATTAQTSSIPQLASGATAQISNNATGTFVPYTPTVPLGATQDYRIPAGSCYDASVAYDQWLSAPTMTCTSLPAQVYVTYSNSNPAYASSVTNTATVTPLIGNGGIAPGQTADLYIQLGDTTGATFSYSVSGGVMTSSDCSGFSPDGNVTMECSYTNNTTSAQQLGDVDVGMTITNPSDGGTYDPVTAYISVQGISDQSISGGNAFRVG